MKLHISDPERNYMLAPKIWPPEDLEVALRELADAMGTRLHTGRVEFVVDKECADQIDELAKRDGIVSPPGTHTASFHGIPIEIVGD